MTAPTITREEVMRLLDYDELTGLFTWRVAPARCRKPGDAAGSRNNNGYTQITLHRRGHSAHRLAWLISNGDWPSGLIDHMNGVRHDNRIANLRVVDTRLNAQNRRADQNKVFGAPLGVTWHKGCEKWQASITDAGKCYYLGLHETQDAAHQAYVAAKRELHIGGLL